MMTLFTDLLIIYLMAGEGQRNRLNCEHFLRNLNDRLLKTHCHEILAPEKGRSFKCYEDSNKISNMLLNKPEI